MKKTVVLGATDNPSRFAYLAANKLKRYGHPIVPVGIRKGEVAGEQIITDKEPIAEVDTVTLYVGTKNLPGWYDYILSLKPKRIIFNPGTENQELEKLARQANIETIYGCTLVMLSAGDY
ncbi:MAG: CoA-binding protein [Adhaeribacter sp.]|nr:CoA-binding protein [Adhaeribacter sp.]